MTAPLRHPLIEAYLGRLDRALRELPAAGRDDLMAEIREHIEAAWVNVDESNESEVRDLLDRLGTPEDIAAEAKERYGVRPVKPGAVEILALVLLPIGGFIVPFVGWIVGVILLWISELWTVRDKLVGTLFVPGGLVLPAALGLFFFPVGPQTLCKDIIEIRTGTGRAQGSTESISRCVENPGFPPEIFLALLVVLALLCIGAVIYLGRRLYSRPA